MVKVEKVENKHLWKRFDLEREIVAERRGRTLAPLPYDTQRGWLTQKYSLVEHINESILFHGTKPNSVEKILNEGFEERQSSQTSLFGPS